MSEDQNTGKIMTRRGLIGASAAVGTACLAGCMSGSRQTETETTATQEYDGVDVSTIEVEGINGNIEVYDEQRETIHVETTKRAADEEKLELITLEDDRAADRLSLTVDTEDTGIFPLGSPILQMDLTLTVPKGLDVSAKSVNGMMNIETTDTHSVSAQTINGKIDIETTDTHSVSAQTDNGGIALSLVGASNVEASTTNGNVLISLPPTAEPAVSFDTRTGQLEATGLEAGSINADSGVNTNIGDGTVQLTVDTTVGNLTIQGASE